MKFGAGKKAPAFGKAAPPKAAKAGNPFAKKGTGGTAKEPGAKPLAPPGLAGKMKGLSPMPRMMRKGGAVKGCK